MSLYDRSVDLQVKLDAAQSADASLELLARGARLVEGLDRASEYLEGTAAFRSNANITDAPALDLKRATQAVGAFRAGLSRHSSAAFQHQPAAALIDVAKSQRDRAARWVSACWKNFFAEYEPLLDQVQTENPVGSGSHRVAARALKLQAARGADPVTAVGELRSRLGGEDVTTWIASIESLGADLRRELAALDDEHAAMTAEVRDALQHAASEEGLPLSEIGAELLAALRAAGVDGHLVVRRR